MAPKYSAKSQLIKQPKMAWRKWRKRQLAAAKSVAKIERVAVAKMAAAAKAGSHALAPGAIISGSGKRETGSVSKAPVKISSLHQLVAAAASWQAAAALAAKASATAAKWQNKIGEMTRRKCGISGWRHRQRQQRRRRGASAQYQRQSALAGGIIAASGGGIARARRIRRSAHQVAGISSIIAGANGAGALGAGAGMAILASALLLAWRRNLKCGGCGAGAHLIIGGRISVMA